LLAVAMKLLQAWIDSEPPAGGASPSTRESGAEAGGVAG